MNRAMALATIGLASTVLGTPGQPATDGKESRPANAAPAAAENVSKSLAATGRHSKLLEAFKAAELDSVLSGEGPLTVFAPTDEAFAKLPPETLESIFKPENKEQLADILKFHIISGRTVMGCDLTKIRECSKTLQGQGFLVGVKEGKVYIGNDPAHMSVVVKTDIKCSNGVVHVVDTVLLPKPKAKTATDDKSADRSAH
ncbi:MAG: fasciclin domain-containing protein [Phycisphaeraceae bacterium]|nr:fasciclin domain-containing protein [Phycisphaeraceae bacterium]